MIRTGGEFRPYTAPVYEGYRQVIRGLTKQGWKAFYKGVVFRIIHTGMHFMAFSQCLVFNKDVNHHSKFHFEEIILKSYALITGIDILMGNPWCIL